MASREVTDMPTVQQLKELFLSYDRRCHPEKYKLYNIPDSVLRSASVLVPLFYKAGEIHVLLTVRTKHMSTHAGHVAFPGGMADQDDTDAIATALRETEEEVGIKPKDIDIIAVLSSFFVRPNSLVTAILGLLPDDFEVRINPREVDMVFDLPLKRFLSSEGKMKTLFKFDEGLEFYTYHFKDIVHSREVDTWGFTALICMQIALVALQSDQEMCFSTDTVTTKANCFTTKVTQTIIDNWRAKL